MSFLRLNIVAFCVFTLASLTAPSASAQSTSPAPCTIPQGWVSAGIPNPLMLAQGTFNDFCAFHTWAWNAFLWMMEPEGDGLRFEHFPTQAETIDPGTRGNNNGPQPTLSLRAAKGDHPIDSIAQAGTLGLLVAQNQRGVYYSQHVNPQMFENIISKDWNNAEGLIKTPATAAFEIGDIELKAAWAIVDGNFRVPGAYTRRAQVPLLVNVAHQGLTTVTLPQDPTYVEAEVALIGLHVVGWVNGHSEAIWATFSPIDIAPVAGAGAAPGQRVSNSSTPFYKAGTPVEDCNQEALPIQRFDAASQKFAIVTQVCQIYPTGTLPPTLGGDADNAAAITQINASAHQTLPSDTPAKGYFEVGAVWSTADDPTMPDAKINIDFQDILIGSTVLSNPVIETFTQTQIGQDNCFSCHNSLQFQPSNPAIPPLQPSRLNLSHFLMQIYTQTYSQR